MVLALAWPAGTRWSCSGVSSPRNVSYDLCKRASSSFMRSTAVMRIPPGVAICCDAARVYREVRGPVRRTGAVDIVRSFSNDGGLRQDHRPTLARTLARPRLFRRFDRAGQRPVTWVWAPPGSGKTTVVASYLAA